MNKKFLAVILTTMVITLLLVPLLASPVVAQEPQPHDTVLLDETGSFTSWGPSSDMGIGPTSTDIYYVEAPESGQLHWSFTSEKIEDPALESALEALNCDERYGNRYELPYPVIRKMVLEPGALRDIGDPSGSLDVEEGNTVRFFITLPSSSCLINWNEGYRYYRCPASYHLKVWLAGEAINHRPECSFDIAPSRPAPGDPVICLSTSTDPDGDELSYKWFLDNEYVGSDRSVELGQLEPGNYDVTLFIDDGNQGTDECDQSFKVSTQNSGGGMNCEGASYGQTGQSPDISLALLGTVFVPLVISKYWRRMRK